VRNKERGEKKEGKERLREEKIIKLGHSRDKNMRKKERERRRKRE